MLGSGVMIGTGVVPGMGVPPGTDGVPGIGAIGMGVTAWVGIGVISAVDCEGMSFGGAASESVSWRLHPQRHRTRAALRQKKVLFMIAISRAVHHLRA